MDEENKDEQLLQRFMEQITRHVETRWAYFSLTATEKSSGIAAEMARVATIFVFALLVLFFVTFGLAWWLGDLIGNRGGGFALTGLIFIPIGYGLSGWIRPAVRIKIIDAFMEEEQPKNEPNHE